MHQSEDDTMSANPKEPLEGHRLHELKEEKH